MGVLSDCTIVFSGTLSMTRNKFQDLIKKHGAKAGSTVTGNTTHLVCTDSEYNNETQKVSMAKTLGIKIIYDKLPGFKTTILHKFCFPSPICVCP